jgi:hypothetical protein
MGSISYSENRTSGSAMACYFGLKVEVLSRMANCSLIRFRNREFVVDTSDLVFQYVAKRAA